MKQSADAKIQALVDQLVRCSLEGCEDYHSLILTIQNLYNKHGQYQLFKDYSEKEVIDSIKSYFSDDENLDVITRVQGLRTIASNIYEIEQNKKKTFITTLLSKAVTKLLLEESLVVIYAKYKNPFDDCTLEELQLELDKAFRLNDFTKLPKKYDLRINAIAIASLNKDLRDKQIGEGYKTHLAYEALPSKHAQRKGKDYDIVSGKTDFSKVTTPVISVGTGRTQESIFIDPNSRRIEIAYLKFRLQLINFEIENRYKSTPRETLTLLMAHCQDLFPASYNVSRDQILVNTETLEIDPESRIGGGTMVPLDEFLRIKKGICRHHASLAATFAGKLVRDGLLPETEVHIYRNKTHNGAHQIVVLTEDSFVWILDSLNYNAPIKINNSGKMNKADKELYEAFEESFGEDFAETARERFAKK